MSKAIFLRGKRQSRALETDGVAGLKSSRHSWEIDRASEIRTLVDMK